MKLVPAGSPGQDVIPGIILWPFTIEFIIPGTTIEFIIPGITPEGWLPFTV